MKEPFLARYYVFYGDLKYFCNQPKVLLLILPDKLFVNTLKKVYNMIESNLQ